MTDILDGIGRMFLLHKRHSPGQDSCVSLSPSAAGGAEIPGPTLPLVGITWLGQEVSREGRGGFSGRPKRSAGLASEYLLSSFLLSPVLCLGLGT